MKTITAQALKEHLSSAQPVLLDVREPNEYEFCHIPQSTHIPMGEISSRLNELDEEDEIICICHHGMRSMQVAVYLQGQGFSNITNLTGGVDAWAIDVDPSMPRY